MKTTTTNSIKKAQSKQELINRLASKNLNINKGSLFNCLVCEGVGGN